MALGRNFSVLFPLYDITIYALGPGATGTQAPVTGAVGAAGQNTYIGITPNTIPQGTSQLPSGLGADGLFVECISPVVTNAGAVVYPDFGFAPVCDGVSLQAPTPASRCFLDGSYGSNMCPPRAQTVGRRMAGIIGQSLRALLTIVQNGGSVPNMALEATGWKYNSNFQCNLWTKRGWGPGVAGDVVQTPGRIIVWGERYSDAMLKPLASFWQGAFSYTSLRRYLEKDQIPATISGVQKGAVSVASLPTISGGYGQQGPAIFRDARFASNLLATAAAAPFPLSNSQQAGGAQGNVDGQYSGDLGFPFAPVNGSASNASSAIIIQRLGVVPGVVNLAYLGASYGGAIVPDPNGWPVGQNVDFKAYGNVQPLRSESELSYEVPELEVPIDVYGENAALFVTGGGAAIAAGAARVAEYGVSLQLNGQITTGAQAG